MKCLFTINGIEDARCFHCYHSGKEDKECLAGNFPHNICFTKNHIMCKKCKIYFEPTRTLVKDGMVYENYISYNNQYYITEIDNPKSLFTIITGCGLTDEEYIVKEIIK